MKNFKNLLRPIAYTIGKIIASNQKMFDIYRHTDFRGKQFLSEYINPAFQNGIYSCNELKYNIDFSDQIQKSVYLGTI